MLPGRWLAPRPVVLFVLLALVPFLALAWLTVQLVQKDRQLEAQRGQERVEHAADRIVAASHQRLSELEAELVRLAAAARPVPPAHAAFVVAEATGIRVAPAGALVYLPEIPAGSPPSPALFAEGERYEHVEQAPAKAIVAFRRLAASEDPTIRAGALLRLARNQRKTGDADAALSTYRELTALGPVIVDADLPAAVLALSAQCSLLDELDKSQELAATARALAGGLAAGAWPIRRDAWHAYRAEAEQWLGVASAEGTIVDADAEARSAAFESVYDRWRRGARVPQAQWLVAGGRPALVASLERDGRLHALVAGADYLAGAWRDVIGATITLSAADGSRILGPPPDSSPVQAVRASDTSRLPWTVRVAAASRDVYAAEVAWRRRLMLAGLAMMLVVLGGSAYFTVRGVARELAVARLQSDFVAAVSHEFRTPLASVRHLSDLLADRRVDAEADRQRCYGYLSRESARLEQLVEELLDFGRLESGAYPFEFDEIDAVDLVRRLGAELEARVAADGYRIDVATTIDHATVEADRGALSRAVWNLLDNAVKYSPDARTIGLSVGVDGPSVVIRVRDEGLGISRDEQGRIFRKFVRGTNARGRQVKGTGIGLAMVQHIVNAHRGRVTIDSAPGRGSTFSIVLPLLRPRSSEGSEEPDRGARFWSAIAWWRAGGVAKPRRSRGAQ